MFNFRQITLFCILSALAFVSSKAKAIVPASESSMAKIPASELAHSVQRIYQKSLMAAGSLDQMDKRAMVLYHLYNDSNREFSFGLSVAHLTLAIERSTSAPRFENVLNLLQMQKTANGWIKWGNGLKQINQLMVQRLHFAYFTSKLMYNSGYKINQISEAVVNSENASQVKEFIQETIELYPLFEKVHQGGVEFWDKKNLVAAFARWEHQTIIQDRIEQLYEQMPSLIQFAVRNVPGTGIEFFLKALQIRTTLGLKCLSPYKALRTKDFIDSEIRIKQATNFHDLLANNAFDPEKSCFKDEYYTTHFPKRFHDNPEKFSRRYYDFITRDEFDGFVNDNERWLQEAYRNVPLVEFATHPSLEVRIPKYFKDALRMDVDPLKRNTDINREYLRLAGELMSCMGFSEKKPFANWYHYAYYASKSARKVISGDFFIEQDVALKIGTNLASFFGLFQKPAMQAIFARTNNLIALEMLPIGQDFYYEFCVNNKKDFSEFASKLNKEYPHERILIDAFHQYFLAKQETDLKQKKERVTLATTLQVISEQIRVNDNINEAFRYNGSVPLAEYRFNRLATKSGSLNLEYGQQKSRKSPFLRSGRIGAGNYSRDIKEIFNGTQMHLGYDVRTARTDQDLLKLELPEYKALFKQYDLATDVTSIHKYKDTGVYKWANLASRLRHLVAQFRSNMSNKYLFSVDEK
jgi:hypothetical protein